MSATIMAFIAIGLLVIIWGLLITFGMFIQYKKPMITNKQIIKDLSDFSEE
jgi:hypothetical protein